MTDKEKDAVQKVAAEPMTWREGDVFSLAFYIVCRTSWPDVSPADLDPVRTTWARMAARAAMETIRATAADMRARVVGPDA